MTHNLWIIVAIAGFLLLRYPARLAFNRRNEYGQEQFTSYDHKLRRRWLERGMRLAGLFIIITGLQHGCATARHAPLHRAQVSQGGH